MVKQLAPEILLQHLTKMCELLQILEDIVNKERIAITAIDAEQLTQLTASRESLQQQLQQCQQACFQLMQESGESVELSHFIDHYFQQDSEALQALRQQLQMQSQRIATANEENAMHLRIMHDTLSETLQMFGLSNKKNTYGRDGTL